MSYSTIEVPICETDQLADICAGLQRQGIFFVVIQSDRFWKIELRGH